MENIHSTYHLEMSKEELEQAIELWTETKYSRKLKIKTLHPIVKHLSTGFGYDYSEVFKGVSFTAIDKED